jgi:hypothetical protein
MKTHTEEMHELFSESRSMLENAESGAWDKVSRGEQRRRQLLNKLFSEPSENMDVKEVDRIIREVLLINNRLETLTTAACELAKSKSNKIVNGRHAVSQYAMHSG